jgi:RNA polymerase sigma-70 factor (ECF subfamily)
MTEQERANQVQLAAGGDADALQRLIVHYHEPLHATVAKAIGDALRPYLEPDDVLQEAYATAFKKVADCDFDGPGAFYKWLERIALNQVRTDERDRRRQKRDPAREANAPMPAATSYPDLLAHVAGTDTTPSRRLAKQEATAAVLASLARLTDDQRTVIRMRIVESRPAAEVAQTLGKTEAAVHMLTHRALKDLRRLLVSITRYLTDL